MSITAKQYLIKTVSAQLCRDLTAADLETVQDRLNEVLAMFEVETAAEGKNDAESEDLLDAFLTAKRIEGRSEKTLTLYRYRIGRLIQAADVPIRHLTVYHLRKYLMDQKDAGLADKTLEGMRSIYCSFFGWLHNEGLLPMNPCANLAAIKCAKVVRLPYSDVDLEQLREACKTNRDRAIMSFLLATGCRVGEIVGLNKKDVKLNAAECIVLGKGNKERTVFLDPVSGMLIKQYLDTRKDTCPALFAGKGSERLTPGGVRFMLRNLADRTGVDHVHPHKFRRTLATNLIHHGMPIQEVAAILGHDKLDTTMQYVVLDKSDVRNAYRKYA